MTAMDEYREFWARIVETDGVIDIEKVARELADYRTLLREVPKVYMHVTGGKLSKPHYPAQTVIDVAREHNAAMLEFALIDARAEWEVGRDGGGPS